MTSKICAKNADQSIATDWIFDKEEVGNNNEDGIVVTEVCLPRLPDTQRLAAASLFYAAAAAQRKG